jgi:hypothetical protein
MEEIEQIDGLIDVETARFKELKAVCLATKGDPHHRPRPRPRSPPIHRPCPCPRRCKEAEAHYRVVLKNQPANQRAHCCLAQLLMEHLARPEEAEVHFQTALQLHPHYAAASARYGVLLTEAFGKHEEAAALFQRTLEAPPLLSRAPRPPSRLLGGRWQRWIPTL